jgi:ribose/xylose/arabinose/galactoside ABC-type transport system permease subunit
MVVRVLPWLVAALIVIVCVVQVRAFRRADYWLTLTQMNFAAAALALVLTPIILTGGIDLSVGSVTVFASVVIGVLMQRAGWPVGWAMLAGLAAGLLAGLVNGSLVAVGIMPLVATLATREFFRGAAKTLVGASPPPSNLAAVTWWNEPAGGLPVAVYGIAALFLLTYLVVHHTWIGRMVYALGDNEQAARFAGVPVRRLKLGLYAVSGLMAGLCGAVMVMRYQAAKADAEKSLELLAIACVVLGGIRITGGAGHVAGTLLGIVTFIILWAAVSRVAADWRETITGVVLIGVAILNEAAARWSAVQPAREA